ncbi:sensor histidine kinase [Klenkia brasiliensis]|uniref:histidine kinase n=1 Tax=Klenkia brasiliensis TaxID=333142 RepID=A0A1G7QLA6_9ACTN|nr:HAMP domain-containing sensor histidine kinase [Klenkia brasiliensis]SDF99272.1 two-component system, OmpR family, sensor kinase [Klenkia brasiliensis]
MTARTEPAARPARRRLSLRARLLVAFLVPTVLVLGVVCLASTLTLRHQLVQQVDEGLGGAGERALRQVYDYDDQPPGGAPASGQPPVQGPEELGGPGQGEGTVVAYVEGGQVTNAVLVDRAGDYTGLSTAQKALLAGLTADTRPETVDLGEGLGEYRVVAETVNDGAVVVTGLPLEGVSKALTRLVLVELVAGVVAVLLAALAAGLTIRRQLRPLDRVAATATRVSQLELSTGEVQLAERVPPADTDRRTEVGQVGAALNTMLDHVEGSLAARQASETQVRQFVADASHELRTPLASIRGYAELVRRQHADVQPEVGHALRRVESEAVRMSGLVEDLLLLARLDAGRDLSVDEVDLAALLVDAVSDAHVAGPDHRWRVDLPDHGVVVPGDGARLHQVLANLLANVRTHTPAGTTATARLRTEDGWAVVEVVDDGPGIPPQLQAHVFERFARGDSSRSRQAGSTGLGLAIVDAVVTAHHGTVAVAGGPGRTAFTIRLPHATVVTADLDPELEADASLVDDAR